MADALAHQYDRLKRRAWAAEHEGVQEVGGKVCEHCLRAAQHMAGQSMTGLTTEIRNMEAKCEALTQLPRGSAPEAIRVVIPRVLLAVYTLRNKRSGGHTAAEVSPSQMDAAVMEHMADWLVAELVRLGHQLPPDEATALIASLIERRIPAVYRDGSFRRVLTAGLPPRAEIEILLYAEAAGATIPQLADWSGIPRSTLGRHLDALEGDRHVRIDRTARPNRVVLLPPGLREVEQSGWLEPS